MVPFLGRPLIDHLLQTLIKFQITNILMSSRGREGDLESYLGDGKPSGLHIRYCPDIGDPGSAAVVHSALAAFRAQISDPFIVVYGDSLLNANFDHIIRAHLDRGAAITIASHQPRFDDFLAGDPRDNHAPHEARTNYGVMEVEQSGQITHFIEKPRLLDIPQSFTRPMANASVYVISRTGITDLFACTRDFGSDYFPQVIAAGIQCYAFDISPGYRIDIGTVHNYVQTTFDVLRGTVAFDLGPATSESRTWVSNTAKVHPTARLGGPLYIGDRACVGAYAQISNSVVDHDVILEEDAIVSSSVLLPRTVIRCGAKVVNAVLGFDCAVAPGVELPAQTVIGDDCLVGGVAFGHRLVRPVSKFSSGAD